jgi:hypothetical protein
VTQYFLTALNNAPKNPFLRKTVGRWVYNYEQEAGVSLIRKILAGDEEKVLVSPSIARNFSNFLYTIRMDYASDREARHIGRSEEGESEPCKIRHVLQRSPDNQNVEFGHDDGSAEWRTRLTSETSRVKKVICLPENLAEYTNAALKIFMNSDGNSNFTAQISIDDHLIKQDHQTMPSIRSWHEIPFDNSILQGKSSINVYVRFAGVPKAGKYLEIWGDQDTPTTQSVLNYNTKDDLSSEEGVQTGEYMIRLVLRKL